MYKIFSFEGTGSTVVRLLLKYNVVILTISAAAFDTGDKELSFGDDNSDLFAGLSSATTKVNTVVWYHLIYLMYTNIFSLRTQLPLILQQQPPLVNPNKYKILCLMMTMMI